MIYVVYADWTVNSCGANCLCELDSSIKYSGVSSYKNRIYRYNAGASANYLTHNTFLESQAQIILWTRIDNLPTNSRMEVNLSTYGYLSVTPDIINDWQKFKAEFWYDISSNTRWGRVYKWNGSAWAQEGTDTNFGTGSPSAGDLVLRSYLASYTHTVNYWFDEVEVYS